MKTTENLEKVTRYDKRDSVSRQGRGWEWHNFYRNSGSGFEPSASENNGGKDKGGKGVENKGGKGGKRGKGGTGDE